jgi:hypothetical protein
MLSNKLRRCTSVSGDVSNKEFNDLPESEEQEGDQSDIHG